MTPVARSWPTLRPSILAFILGLVSVFAPSMSSAFDFETLVSPGPLIEGHTEVETSCKRCHSPFERASEADLCLECHEGVADDLRSSAGFHGSRPADSGRSCRGCHSEHLGREADIVGLDSETFDHGSTDYPLAGAHARTACGSCHLEGRKKREAPTDCVACHTEQDVHRGQLGQDCQRCHSEATWRQARFDHARTDFPLEGGHVEVPCGLCHPGQRYEGTPTRCQDCHSVDDAHRGRFGEGCGDCHGTASWKKGSFDHGSTRFALKGQHADVACSSCHRGSASPERSASTTALDTRCVACHRADDEHRGRYGEDCGSCHDASGWLRIGFDHLRDARFALSGAHHSLECEACHRGALREAKRPESCHGCHAADDVHRGQEGRSCESCHGEASWTDSLTFDHELTRFPLLGLHALAPCEECHQSMAFRDAPEDCSACHLAVDAHSGALGSDCAICHNPNAWELWRFDHSKETRFALGGSHRNLQCRGCHDSRSGSRSATLQTSCDSCHASDDPHRGSFGSRCESCHEDSDWKEVRIGR